MKIAVIGGTGLIGSQVVNDLNAAGHEAVAHALSTGVDIISGRGVDEAVAGVDVVVNVTTSPTFDDASLAFFQTSMDNLLASAPKGGVGHFVILSIVGADQVPELDYYRAKVLQEKILAAGPVPYSIVRATQFMDFMDAAPRPHHSPTPRRSANSQRIGADTGDDHSLLLQLDLVEDRVAASSSRSPV
ncbi:SDR family oxidoreductase [Streptomyces sp. NRRL S-337]|uniref:SDR family oxidoreductase n=1 Tax=Streptomyces sp. NRRL S-337 TaxID=1463900 RepID=UPI00099C5537|nr:NAD(P)H-binding protein [Streptomyces sp. NRRL S-337]